MKIGSLDLAVATMDEVANQIEKMEGNATVYISDNNVEPFPGLWRKTDEIGKEGVYWVSLGGNGKICECIAAPVIRED